MAIPLFVGDARRTDSYAEATIQIPGYQITEEMYRVVSDAIQFLIVIKQSAKACSGDRISRKNAQIDRNLRLQLLSTEIVFTLKNLVPGMQPALDEVFDVRS
ncbi:hypothetical protein [Calothrix sp. NIES-2098]|uniref:hypothetical protein n=1 Tax=Calothrix sp. NIES-2098 TaxID=1954171 RepID=UPI000B621738|nr:hypothetical protein NIES2098_08290 [Calothrix sp. NIES-2098]